MDAKRYMAHVLASGRAFVSSVIHPPQEESRDPYQVFLTPEAAAINGARQEHLASLGLDLAGKKVLEVGAGIGLHTQFFLERGCDVVVTDGNRENVDEIRRRHPQLRAEQADLDGDADLRTLGSFDVVYCYGLLYHLANPERAIMRMAQVCTGQLLLETCVSLGRHSEVIFLQDFQGNNQATTGVGCRPTRRWVMDKLRQYFGNEYHAVTQPAHADFPTDWECPATRMLYRSVFVGSKRPLQTPTLLQEIPPKQVRCGSPP
jgi:2-polyprenyl-3-methyl-5-hydroxy-6-metoxy-1,4-benzoquinol methylase